MRSTRPVKGPRTRFGSGGHDSQRSMIHPGPVTTLTQRWTIHLPHTGPAQVQLGTLPEWFAAIGTVGALLISLYLLKEQRDDWQKERLEALSAQARQVTIWADSVEDNGSNLVVSYIAQNASGDPIYAVTARLPTGTQGTFIRYVGMMGPGERRRVRIMVGRAQPVGDKSPEILFADSNDRTWYRGRRGVLAEIGAVETSDLTKPLPGAYPSLEENPYLNQLPPDEPRQGTKL